MKMIFYFSLVLFVLCSEWMSLLEGHEMECRVKGSCRDCVRTPGCSWCAKVQEGRGKSENPIPGCYGTNEIAKVCPEKNIQRPRSFFEILKNEPVRDSRHGDSIQIQPQKVELSLSVGTEFTIEFKFRKAEDYPIDLYYLMDFSLSMADYKGNLSALGNKLAETMKNITSNFQLGFGSFVDKVALPFTSTKPEDFKNPCKDCTSPYSFKNHMALSRQTERFSDEVKKAKMSGNLDAPEGVLDALMQATVCKKEINWREKARHILVLSTDGRFHLAGDGKMGGVVEPNDGSCHLDEQGYYTEALRYDYPSVSQINQMAVDNSMNIIFAVTNKVRDDYMALSDAIHGASLGFLDRGQNIAELVMAQYEKVSTKVRLTDSARGSVYITYSVLCPGEKEWKKTNECSGVKGGSVASFKAHVTVMDCSDVSLTNQGIHIKPLGINESLVINFHTICDCECAEPKHLSREANSSYCSGSGDLVCGQCVCSDGKIGERCECSGSNAEDITSTETCKADKTSSLICSGQGECKCGVCQCRQGKNSNEEIGGKFCECDNYSCPKHGGLLCSGHGTCQCKKCACNPGWTGESCDCPLDDNLCKRDMNEEPCSGRGECTCGVCHCYYNATQELRYSGKYCHMCMNCHQQCDLHNDCVECLVHGSGPHKQNECLHCTYFFHNFTEDAKELHTNITSSDLCIRAEESGCTFKYIYYYDDDGRLIIAAERTKTCPEKTDLVAVVLGTTGGTVLIGILILLLWKLLTTIHDKREYEKFEKERQRAHWGRGDNPLYRGAVKTYKNPTFHKVC